MQKKFRGIILSGGGARGAYSAGVVAAIKAIDEEIGNNITNYFAGSSIGALNAILAAQGDLLKLLELWKNLNTRRVLGEKSSKIKGRKVFCRSGRRPFSYFYKNNVKEIISENVDYKKLKNSHVMITATNLTLGKPETFFISDYLPEFIKIDKANEAQKQRLINYHRVESQEHLEKVLLASTAIPFFLEPVKIGTYYYIDGGVGNNTALQQAALFSRYLNNSKNETGSCDTVICNLLDSGRFVLPQNHELEMGNIIRRTVDIFQNVITGERLTGWEQVNESVKKFQKFKSDLADYIQASSHISEKEKISLLEKIDKHVFSTSLTPRQNFKLIIIHPSVDVELENALDFNTRISNNHIKAGYSDTLKEFRAQNMISLAEKERIENYENFGVRNEEK